MYAIGGGYVAGVGDADTACRDLSQEPTAAMSTLGSGKPIESAPDSPGLRYEAEATATRSC